MSDYEEYETTNRSIDLSSFDDDFATAEAPDYDEIPDGKYQVRVDSVRIDTSQKGDPMIKWDLVVISGSMANRHIFKNSAITQASLPIVKGELGTVGIQLARFSDLANRLEELLDIVLEVTKRKKGEYTNIYFNRRLQIPSAVTGDSSLKDVPF